MKYTYTNLTCERCQNLLRYHDDRVIDYIMAGLCATCYAKTMTDIAARDAAGKEGGA